MNSIEIKTVKLIANSKGYLINNTTSFLIKDNNELLNSVNDWLEKGNIPEPEHTEAELLAIAQAKKLAEASAYLASTDWITSKYNDVVTVLGTMSKADFVAKYKEIYDNRTAARAVLNGGE